MEYKSILINLKRETMEKRNKIIYSVATGLFSLMALMAVVLYVVKHDMVAEMFTKLGYPTYLIYPLGLAKFLGVIAIVTRKSEMLKEWAYAGFVMVLLLAASAHYQVGDGEFAPPLVEMLLLITSYVFGRKVYNQEKVA